MTTTNLHLHVKIPQYNNSRFKKKRSIILPSHFRRLHLILAWEIVKLQQLQLIVLTLQKKSPNRTPTFSNFNALTFT